MNLRKAAFVLPNLFTLGSLFCGFYSITASFGGNGSSASLYQAGIAILFGIFFDAFDGRVARMTKTQSDLGLQLDSLCDLVTFGLAPACLAYNWGLASLGVPGLLVCFAWVAAGALRLARFNVLAIRANAIPGSHITGLPIPCAAAMIVALSLVAHHASGTGHTAAVSSLVLIMLSLTFLMVSAVKFRAFKSVGWRSRRTVLTIALAAVAIAAVWVKLRGAYVFLFLISLYIGLGLLEALALRSRRPAAPPAAPRRV